MENKTSDSLHSAERETFSVFLSVSLTMCGHAPSTPPPSTHTQTLTNSPTHPLNHTFTHTQTHTSTHTLTATHAAENSSIHSYTLHSLLTNKLTKPV